VEAVGGAVLTVLLPSPQTTIDPNGRGAPRHVRADQGKATPPRSPTNDLRSHTG
jgi:hypothetical protein